MKIVAHERVVGVVVVESFEREYAFGPSEVRLLQTIVASMGVALENARLFDETQRLLKETEQRNAELAIIHSIQQGMSATLDFRAIVDLVGDKLEEIFHTGILLVGLVDRERGEIQAPYFLQRGKRFEVAPIAWDKGLAGHVVQTRKPLLLNRGAAARGRQLGGRVLGEPGRDTHDDQDSGSYLGAPVLAGKDVIGVIGVYAERDDAFTEADSRLLETLAASMGVALENARLFDRTAHLLKETEQRNAELAVINSIQQGIAAELDFQAIVDVVGDKLREVFASDDVGIRWHDPQTDLIHQLYVVRRGERLRPEPVAPSPQGAWRQMQVARQPVVANSQREMVEMHLLDAPDPEACRSLMGVPILSGERMLGLIGVESFARDDAFSAADVRLLATVAASMGLALENVRLFNETREALERQTATADILKVISGSPTDTQPVFDAIVQSAARLFGRKTALRTRGPEGLRRVARSYESTPDEFHGADLMPLDRDSLVGRAVLDGKAQQTADISSSDSTPYAQANSGDLAFRAIASAPLMLDGSAIGVISMSSPVPGALSSQQMDLLSTFADQAVIAIQNTRLFNETKEALEQQTRHRQVLQVVSQSPTDVQPVFDAIVESALALCDARMGGVARYDGELVHLAAFHGPSAEGVATMRAGFPMKPGAASVLARAVAAGEPVQIYDVLADPDYALKAATVQLGYRSNLGVPMIRDGEVIGSIGVCREEPSVFPEKHVRLLRIFADQAVIAIENVRLFNETREALEQQTATAEILKVIASSPSDVQPVFDAIVRNAVTICESMFANVFRFDGELLHWAASHNLDPDTVELLRRNPRRPEPSLLAGRVILTAAVARLPDALADPEYDQRFVVTCGWRKMLGAPMLRDGRPVGAIVVGWHDPGPISARHEEILKTFADQAVIAIENVRLFNETRDALHKVEQRTRELSEALDYQTAISEVLRVISQSPTDVAPVFEAILDCATRLFGSAVAAVYRYRGGLVELVATRNWPNEALEIARSRLSGAAEQGTARRARHPVGRGAQRSTTRCSIPRTTTRSRRQGRGAGWPARRC